MALSREEVREVRKRDLLYGMEDELWKLIKRRVITAGILVVVIAAGGLWVAVELVVQRVAETPLRDFQKEVIRAEVQADAAKRASDGAKASAEQLSAGLETLNKTLQALNEQARAVGQQFAQQQQEIDAASRNAALRSQRDFNIIQQRIRELETLVRKIGDENDATRKATVEYAKQVAALETKIEKEQKRFAENSEFTLSIAYDPSKKALATEAQNRLTIAGFRVTVRESKTLAGIKGNSLLYQTQSEAKAQDVVALMKPLIKDLQVRKVPSDPNVGFPEYKSGTERIDKSPFPYLPLYAAILDPKNMQLTLGAE